ncbi:SusD/RagB family nutrient-binding outer membrane lipoprotein [Flavisolibacter nicotianae]|uniref:SusD/RagB family nutrient-binding outer membrane lipoprotein n=1 Tax=Flavisolibacter nicotianae TaxID=2364882 RepID=UPI000EB30F27|nr:SusD/RagB family nutrient-binding outer membrane lipoprotein [Flavisolibacter nicotianae]
MKRATIKILGALFLVSTLGTSCKKYLDINKNPNAAEVVDPKLLFSNAIVNYVNVRAGGDLYIPISLTGQAIASGGNNPTAWGFPSEEQYDVNALSLGNTWRTLYTFAGVNLKEVIRLAEAAPVKNNNAAAQAKVLLGFVFEDLTTLYGDVPFTEALNTDIAYPKFDPQPVVLEGIIKLCDDALAQFDEASPLKISDYDLFYKGDIAKWKKVARSLKLRTLMIMVDKDPSKAAAIGQMVTAGGMLSSPADNFLVAYYNTAGRYNPKYGLNKQYNSEQSFFGASKWLVNFMNPINDPRLGIFFEKPATAATYVAPDPGEDLDDDVHARVNRNFHNASEPEVLFSYQEELFYEAEVYARGLGVSVDMAKANTLYKKAVEESVKFYAAQAKAATLVTSGGNSAAFLAAADNAAATAATFAASLPNLSSFGSQREAVKYIHYHHWIDKWDRGLDAFTQWRRSGPEGDEVPPLTLPTGAPAGGLFRRYEYPVTAEIAANPNAPKEKIRYDTKMWFDL